VRGAKGLNWPGSPGSDQVSRRNTDSTPISAMHGVSDPIAGTDRAKSVSSSRRVKASSHARGPAWRRGRRLEQAEELGFAARVAADHRMGGYEARSRAQALTWPGSAIRAGKRETGSAPSRRHWSACTIRSTSSPAGRCSYRNATASSVVQLVNKACGIQECAEIGLVVLWLEHVQSRKALRTFCPFPTLKLINN
jgi:hypothetical protein